MTKNNHNIVKLIERALFPKLDFNRIHLKLSCTGQRYGGGHECTHRTNNYTLRMFLIEHIRGGDEIEILQLILLNKQ